LEVLRAPGSVDSAAAGSATLYYIFTLDEIGGPNGFRYSIVDMSLQGGNGGVTNSKNVLIQNTVTEKLTAVKKINGTDYWIAIHEWGTNAFYVYSLTSGGFQTTPVSATQVLYITWIRFKTPMVK